MPEGRPALPRVAASWGRPGTVAAETGLAPCLPKTKEKMRKPHGWNFKAGDGDGGGVCSEPPVRNRRPDKEGPESAAPASYLHACV